MDFHRKDPRLVEWASRAIAVIAGENVDARKQFTDMNGTAILLMSMSLFPTNENIQHCICYALSRTVSTYRTDVTLSDSFSNSESLSSFRGIAFEL